MAVDASKPGVYAQLLKVAPMRRTQHTIMVETA
jgi:hypothetical protein